MLVAVPWWGDCISTESSHAFISCELRAVQFLGQVTPLHLSRDGVQMCLTDDAGGLTMDSGLSGRQTRSIPSSSVIASEEKIGAGSSPLVGCLSGRKMKLLVALVKNMLAPEILTID